MALESGPGPMEVAHTPPQHSDVLEAHFRLQDASSVEDLLDLVGDGELPQATESPEMLAARPHDEWERKWIAALRQPPAGHDPAIADTNNFWNYFRPRTVELLRALLTERAEERREWTIGGGEEGYVPSYGLGVFEAQLLAWITSGVMNDAIQRFGTHQMERLLNDIRMLEIPRKETDAANLAVAQESRRSVSRESGELLGKLAVIMYDLGVSSRAIFG